MKKIIPEVKIKSKQQGGGTNQGTASGGSSSSSRSGSNNNISSSKQKKKLKVDQKQQCQKTTSSFHSEYSVISDTKINTYYLPHLDLGDPGKSHDMLTRKASSKKIDSLQLHDFAFIYRSNGSWTYAIIADKHDDYIRFVVDGEGSAKVTSRKSWSKYIRLVNPERAAC